MVTVLALYVLTIRALKYLASLANKTNANVLIPF